MHLIGLGISSPKLRLRVNLKLAWMDAINIAERNVRRCKPNKRFAALWRQSVLFEE